jgi:DnaJ-domain-containing protein 1
MPPRVAVTKPPVPPPLSGKLLGLMAIGRRLFDMARSELNSLLDKAAHLGEGDDEDQGRKPDADGLEAFSEAELEAELERRRLDRDLEERVANAAKRANAKQGSPPPPRPPSPTHSPPDKVAKAYGALELPNGSDFAAVKQQYRKLMRKYHPDHHTRAPEKEKAAHELTQKLTEAYKLLEKQLRPR